MICELTVVLALAGTILVALLGHGHVDFSPFNPMQALHGRQGLFAGLVFALLTFVGLRRDYYGRGRDATRREKRFREC